MTCSGRHKLAFKDLQYDALKTHLMRSRHLDTTANCALIHDKVFQDRPVARAIAAAIVIAEGLIYSGPEDKRVAKQMLRAVPDEAVDTAWDMLGQTDLSPPGPRKKKKRKPVSAPELTEAKRSSGKDEEKKAAGELPKRVSYGTLDPYADKSELIRHLSDTLLQKPTFKDKPRESIIAASLIIDAGIAGEEHDLECARDLLKEVGDEGRTAFRMLFHSWGLVSPADPQTNDDRLLLYAMKCARDLFLKNSHLRFSEGRFYLDYRKVYAKLVERSLLVDFWMWVKDDYLYRDSENSWKRKPDPDVLFAGRQRLRAFIDAIKSKKPWAIERIRKMMHNGSHGNPPPLEEMFFEMHADLFNALVRRGLIDEMVKSEGQASKRRTTDVQHEGIMHGGTQA